MARVHGGPTAALRPTPCSAVVDGPSRSRGVGGGSRSDPICRRRRAGRRLPRGAAATRWTQGARCWSPSPPTVPKRRPRAGTTLWASCSGLQSVSGSGRRPGFDAPGLVGARRWKEGGSAHRRLVRPLRPGRVDPLDDVTAALRTARPAPSLQHSRGAHWLVSPAFGGMGAPQKRARELTEVARPELRGYARRSREARG